MSSSSSSDEDDRLVHQILKNLRRSRRQKRNNEETAIEAHLNIGDVLKSAKVSKDFCDVTIKNGEKQYPVHSLVIKLTIPYFRTATETTVGKECGDDSDPFDLTDAPVTDEVLGEILNYAYGGKISGSIPLIPLHEAADFFGMDDLAKECVKKMENTKLNCDQDGSYDDAFTLIFSMMKYAKRGFKGSVSLLKTCLDEIVANLSYGARTETFRHLSVSDVVTILSHKTGQGRVERECWAAAMNWLYGYLELDERAKCAVQLFKCIDWELLDPDEIRSSSPYRRLPWWQKLSMCTEGCRVVLELLENCLGGSEDARDQILGADRVKNRHVLKHPVVLMFNPRSMEMHSFTLRSQDGSFSWEPGVFDIKGPQGGQVLPIAVCADKGNAYIWCQNEHGRHSLFIRPLSGGSSQCQPLPEVLANALSSIEGWSDQKCIIWKEKIYFVIVVERDGSGKHGSLFVCGVSLNDGHDVFHMWCPQTDLKSEGLGYRLNLVDGHVLVSSDNYPLTPARIDLSLAGSKRSYEIFSVCNFICEPIGAGLVKHGSRIYMAGGQKLAAYYDENTKKWEPLPNLHFERLTPSILVAADDKLFVFDEFLSNNEDPPQLENLKMEWLDLRSQDSTWQLLPDIPAGYAPMHDDEISLGTRIFAIAI